MGFESQKFVKKEQAQDLRPFLTVSKVVPSSEMSKLGHEERERLSAEAIKNIIDVFDQGGGSNPVNTNKVYNSLPNHSYLVRREDPLKLIESIATNEPIKIFFHKGNDAYNNAIEWSPFDGSGGTNTTYLEGHAELNNVTAVIGFLPGDKIKMHNVTDTLDSIHGRDRAHVRSISGEIDPSDIVFVTLRMLAGAYERIFSDANMSDTETQRLDDYEEAVASGKRSDPVYVSRTITFPKNLALENGEMKSRATG
jgi:hypothetical protein